MLGRSTAAGNVCAAYKERISFSWLGRGGAADEGRGATDERGGGGMKEHRGKAPTTSAMATVFSSACVSKPRSHLTPLLASLSVVRDNIRPPGPLWSLHPSTCMQIGGRQGNFISVVPSTEDGNNTGTGLRHGQHGQSS